MPPNPGESPPTAVVRRGRRYFDPVPNLRGELPFDVEIAGQPVAAHTGYWWSGGGPVLTIATVLPDRGLAFEQISTYIGHPDTDTTVTHLTVAYGQRAETETYTCPYAQLNTLRLTRGCAYNHVHQLIDKLAELGLAAQVKLADETFSALERVQ